MVPSIETEVKLCYVVYRRSFFVNPSGAQLYACVGGPRVGSSWALPVCMACLVLGLGVPMKDFDECPSSNSKYHKRRKIVEKIREKFAPYSRGGRGLSWVRVP